MRSRPLCVFMVIAASLVLWFSARMWLGQSFRVWQISTLLGAWSPLGAAFIFLYVRAVGGREHSVLAAWLVRAIGMHCMLLWLVGAGDFLRGPPGHPPRFDADAGAPLVLLGFAPVFALSLAILGWVRSIDRRLDGDSIHPLSASQHSTFSELPPYRGVVMLQGKAPLVRPAVAALLVASVGAFALLSDLSPSGCLALCSLGLSLVAVPGWRAVGPSVVSLAALSFLALSQRAALGDSDPLALAMQWPWACALLVVIYLASVEARVRASAINTQA